jgi:diacylglycerol kinase (ATP)
VGANTRHVAALALALRRHGLEPQIAWEPGARAAALGRSTAAEEYHAVVAAGGDGTVAAVVNDLRAALPVAVLPLGRENLFARWLGVPRDPEALARSVARGRVRRIDLGRANGRLFVLMAGVGFDAEVVGRMARWRTRDGRLRRVTRASYARPILAALGRYTFPRLDLQAPEAYASGVQALVANVPVYAAGLRVAPRARADDGILDWVMLTRPGRAPLVRYVVAAWRDRLAGRPDVLTGRADRVRIVSSTPVPVQLDGDPAGLTPVEITVQPAALVVITPAA